MPDFLRLNAVINVATGSAFKGLRELEAQGRATAAAMGRLNSSAARLSGALANIATIGAVAQTFTSIVAVAAEFELAVRQINSIVLTSGDTAEDAAAKYEEYYQRLRDISAETGIAAGPIEAARAAYEIASSGFEDAASNTEVLKASLLGASAGLTDTKVAASAIVGVLNSYGLASAEAARINDVMFQTVKLGVVSYDELAKFIGNVVPIAAKAGVSFEEVGAAIATATRAGIDASKATIGLRGVLLKLVSNTEKGNQMLAKHGLVVNETTLKQKGLIATLREIDSALGGSLEKWDAVVDDARALTTALAVVREEGKEGVEFLAEMENAEGSGLQAQEQIAQSFAYSIKQLHATWQTFMIDLGANFLPLAKQIADALNGMLTAFNNLDPATKAMAANLVGIALAGVALRSLYSMVVLLQGGFGTMVGMMGKARGAAAGASAALAGTAAAGRGWAWVLQNGITGAQLGALGATTRLGAAWGALKGTIAGLSQGFATTTLAAGALAASMVGLVAVGLAYNSVLLEQIRLEQEKQKKIQAEAALLNTGFEAWRKYGGKSAEAITKTNVTLQELQKQMRAVQGVIMELGADTDKLYGEERMRKLREVKELYHQMYLAAEKLRKEEEARAQAIADAQAKQAKQVQDYNDGLKKAEDALDEFKKRRQRGEFSNTSAANKEFSTIPEGGGVSLRRPMSTLTDEEKQVLTKWKDQKADLEQEMMEDTLQRLSTEAGEVEDYLKQRRASGELSLTEEIQKYRELQAVIRQQMAEAMTDVRFNHKTRVESARKMADMLSDIETRIATAKKAASKVTTKDDEREFQAKKAALEAEVRLRENAVKMAMKKTKNIVQDEGSIRKLIQDQLDATMRLLALEEQRALIVAKQKGARKEELDAIKTEFSLKRQAAQEEASDKYLDLDAKIADKIAARGKLQVKVIEGQIEAIDAAIDRLSDDDQGGASANSSKIYSLLQRRLQLSLDAIEKEKNAALEQARARQASEEEIAEIIIDAEQKKQAALRDTADAVRDLKKEAQGLGNTIVGGVEEMAASLRDGTFLGKSIGAGGVGSDPESIMQNLADQEHREVDRLPGIDPTDNRSAGIIVDRWGPSTPGSAMGSAGDQIRLTEPPSVRPGVSGEAAQGIPGAPQGGQQGGVEIEEVQVKITMSVDGNVKVVSDKLSDGSVMSVLDDLQMQSRLAGRGKDHGTA